MAALFELSGGASVAGARSLPALAAVGLVAATWLLGRRWASPRAAVWAAGMVALFPVMLQWGRTVRSDTLMAACVAFATVLTDDAAGASSRRRSWLLWLGACVLAGAGVLSKGPQALFFFAVAVVAVWRARRGRWGPPWAFLAAAPVAVALLPGAWAAACELREPGYLRAMFGYQFGEALGEHPRPLWFYPVDLLYRTGPWSVFVVGAAWAGVRGFRRRGYDRAAIPAVVFLIALLGLSVVPNRRAHYLLPVMPMWALLLAGYLDEAVRRAAPQEAGSGDHWPRGLRRLCDWPVRLVLAGLLAAAGTAPFLWYRRASGGLAWVVLACVPVLVAAAHGLVASFRRRPLVAVWTLVLTVAGAMVAAGPLYRRHLVQPDLDFVAGRAMAALLPADAPIGIYGCPGLTLFALNRSAAYLRRDGALRDFLKQPGPCYVVSYGAERDEIERVSPVPLRRVGRWPQQEKPGEFVVLLASGVPAGAPNR
jgi:4-amino-4-deoxy-L-arabinose transferase-like glycosyltransferase